MLGSSGEEEVFLSFYSNHSFCVSRSLLFCILAFWEVSAAGFLQFLLPLYLLFFGKSFDWYSTFKILKSSFTSFTWWLTSSLWLASSWNQSRSHFFWTLLFTSLLSLMAGIKCFSFLSFACSPNSQSFDFSRTRATHVTRLSPSLVLLARRESRVILFFFSRQDILA